MIKLAAGSPMAKRSDDPKAVVLLSGGLDSATTLAIARDQGLQCHAITFDYGQRHRIELEAAAKVAKSLGAREHVIMKIDLRAFGGSALTADIDVPKDRPVTPREAHGVHAMGVGSEIPITYVPARNTIFLSLALGYAEVRSALDIFIGVNAVDYSGYPDCRPEFIAAFERTANLATKMGVEGRRVTIHTPLIGLTKAQIIHRGVALGVDYGLTFSCYDPGPQTGNPCGHCDSCLLRATGFRSAGMNDPALRQ
jgi:7-cyano-7-deazaguanine synthase